MIRATGTLWLLLALPSPSVADTLDAYLLKAVGDTQYAVVRESEGSVHTGVSGWIDEAQFRFQAEDDHRDPIKKGYTLRITPKYGIQRSAEQSIHEIGIRQRMLNADLVLSGALKTRYLMLIDFAEQRIKTEYEREHVDLLKVESAFHRALAETTEFNPEKLQGLILELSYAKTTLRMAERRLEARQERIQADIESPDSSNDLLDENWPLTPLHIDEVLIQHQAALAEHGHLPSQPSGTPGP